MRSGLPKGGEEGGEGVDFVVFGLVVVVGQHEFMSGW